MSPPVEIAPHVADALPEAHPREDVELFDVSSTWVTSRGVLIVGREGGQDATVAAGV